MGRVRISGGIQVIDKDRGYKALMKKLGRRLHGMSISVGVQGNDAQKEYDNGATVGEVAGYAEFGTSTQPPRPFLGTAAERWNLWRTDMVKLGRASIDNAPEVLAQKLGEKIVKDIVAVIDTSLPPPNAPSTIAKKGSSRTLVDTGELRDSISAKITNNGGRVPDGMRSGQVE